MFQPTPLRCKYITAILYLLAVQKPIKLPHKIFFVDFPCVENSTGPGGFMVCVSIFMTRASKCLTESNFYGEVRN